MPDRVGQQIGNYRLVKLLGKGGFAEVYLGQHVHLAAKQAAIKILYLIDVDARKFQEEAEMTEKLVHPHIMRLLDYAIHEGTPFLVMDFAPGGSLRARYPKGSRLPLTTVTGYLNEIIPALQYAHDQHVFHRDIKPDNILIGRGGELLLSDFGMAVFSQTGRTSLKSAYDVGGTPYYMAPEQYRGKPEKASDQYALAIVVYEWLCGSVPFSEGNFIQLGFQHAFEPVPPLREKNPAISPVVEAVIKKALSKEPKDRFASVQAFVEAFEQACILTLPAEEPKPGQGKPGKQMPPDEPYQVTGPTGGYIVPPSSGLLSSTYVVTPLSQPAVPMERAVPPGESVLPGQLSTPPSPSTPQQSNTLTCPKCSLPDRVLNASQVLQSGQISASVKARLQPPKEPKYKSPWGRVSMITAILCSFLTICFVLVLLFNTSISVNWPTYDPNFNPHYDPNIRFGIPVLLILLVAVPLVILFVVKSRAKKERFLEFSQVHTSWVQAMQFYDRTYFCERCEASFVS